MDCNHAQNQDNKVSVNPVEGLSIQPVKWWSPWESQLINKGALCLMHPITTHLHESQTNESFGKKWENYIEIRYKNFIPLIQKCIIAWYKFQIDFILQKYYMVNQEFVIFFPKLEFFMKSETAIILVKSAPLLSMPYGTSWHSGLIHHWRSYCHQVRTA